MYCTRRGKEGVKEPKSGVDCIKVGPDTAFNGETKKLLVRNNQRWRFMKIVGNPEFKKTWKQAHQAHSKEVWGSPKLGHSLQILWHVYKNSTTLEHWISCVQMAEPILFLCCMLMVCLVKLFSVYLHKHFMFEPWVSAHGWSTFWTFQYECLYCHLSECCCRQPTREQWHLKWESKIIACLYFYILYEP